MFRFIFNHVFSWFSNSLSKILKIFQMTFFRWYGFCEHRKPHDTLYNFFADETNWNVIYALIFWLHKIMFTNYQKSIIVSTAYYRFFVYKKSCKAELKSVDCYLIYIAKLWYFSCKLQQIRLFYHSNSLNLYLTFVDYRILWNVVIVTQHNHK